MTILTVFGLRDSSKRDCQKQPDNVSSVFCWRCLLAFMVVALGTLVQNGHVHPSLYEISPWTVSVNSVLYGVVFGIVAFAAHRLRKPISLFLMVMISLVTLALGALLWNVAALQSYNTVITIASSVLISFGRCWAVIMTGIVFSGLRPKVMLVTAALGMLLAYALFTVLSPYFASCGILAYTILPGLALLLIYRKAQVIHQGTSKNYDIPNELQVTNPDSFISPTSRLIICIFIFELVFGLSIAFGDEVDLGWQGEVTGLFLLFVACWLLMTKYAAREDALFRLSGFFIMGGFLLVSAESLVQIPLSHTMFSIGSQMFYFLIWVTLATIASRNPAGRIVTLTQGFCASSMGAGFGLVLSNLIGVFDTMFGNQATVYINALCGLTFFAFVWIGLKNFSFTKTIAGVRPVESIETLSHKSDISTSCCALSKRFELTEREQEIFTLLAKGRNGSFIQAEYRITRNTAKTHIRHIYQKLNIHTQQELIDLVESYPQDVSDFH